MPRKSYPVPAVPGIDLGVRPTSYWANNDPLSAIVQNIKGQNRREMARDFIAGGLDEVLGPIHEHYVQDTLTMRDVRHLGQLHPSFYGGEYLPDYKTGEVEIARVVMQTSTQDVFTVRARRVSPGGRFTYRVADEYHTTYVPGIKSSRGPLSLAQLVSLIDGISGDEIELAGGGLVVGWIEASLDFGQTVDDLRSFISVESTVYAELGEYYDARMTQVLDEWEREHRDDDDDDTDDDRDDNGGDGNDDAPVPSPVPSAEAPVGKGRVPELAFS
ncbi:hypothetical protein [Gemmatimonas sp.]|uniref:hypothetical protein n=1 Tax=Gemmatimonas sp. TaxID=1962908 RepID=UPI00356870CA